MDLSQLRRVLRLRCRKALTAPLCFSEDCAHEGDELVIVEFEFFELCPAKCCSQLLAKGCRGSVFLPLSTQDQPIVLNVGAKVALLDY